MQLLSDYNDRNRNEQIVEEIKEEEKEQSRYSSATDKTDVFSPVTKHVDEAGKVVYKLGHYLAQHFGEIFGNIDDDLGLYGIKDYTIKNMTLEQVFLAIGDQELKNDVEKEKSENKEAVQLMDAMPQLEKLTSI